jgi:glutathione synthase/RimK-type ligase-like ATP-grasp enzyme
MSLTEYFITGIMTCMKQSQHPVYQKSEWQAHQLFMRIINDVCTERGITATWLSDYWIAEFTRGDARCLIHGYAFPLNNAVAAAIMRDKVSTYSVLTQHGIAAVPHFLFRFPDEREPAQIIERIGQSPLPLVLKPNAGESGGTDVFKCTTPAELAAAVTTLASRHQTIATSPYIEIKAEYRVVWVDGEPKVVFEKVRPNGQWQHNLKFGALPVLVADNNMRQKLVDMAGAAMAAVQGRAASVDVIDTAEGLQIMEINGGITLNFFSQHSPEFHDLTRSIYADIIEKSLQ